MCACSVLYITRKSQSKLTRNFENSFYTKLCNTRKTRERQAMWTSISRPLKKRRPRLSTKTTHSIDRVKMFVSLLFNFHLFYPNYIEVSHLSFIMQSSKARYPREHLIFKMATRTLGSTEYSKWPPKPLDALNIQNGHPNPTDALNIQNGHPNATKHLIFKMVPRTLGCT